MKNYFLPQLNYDDKNWYNPGDWRELILIGSAYRLGIFKLLSTTKLSAAEIAAKTGTDKRAINVVLKALAAAGYLNRDKHDYRLTEIATQRLIDEKHPDFIGFSISHSLRLAERWLTLPAVLVSGQPVTGDRFSETPEGFIKAMDVYAKKTASEVVDNCLAMNPQAKKVLDIGGATGTVSRLFVKRGLQSTLFDIPAVIELDKVSLEDNPNIELIAGDFNQSLPAGPFDIVYLGNITHIYGGDKNAALFKKIYEILNPGGIIAILDFLDGISPSAPLFAVNMLVNTSEGGAWTFDEFTGWLKSSGFRDIDYNNVTRRDQQLITGVKVKMPS